jgi:hypothetical protein
MPQTLPSQTPLRATPIVVLSALTFISGVGGMAISFLFLASRNYLDVIAGTVGFLAGAVLVAAGLLSLTVQCRSPLASQSAIQVAGCLVGFLPPLVAVLAWPVLYFGAFLTGLSLIPIVLLGCVVWAWLASRSVASNLSALCGWSHAGMILRGLVFFLQGVGILASWPLFAYLLRLLEAMGYKVGWS